MPARTLARDSALVHQRRNPSAHTSMLSMREYRIERLLPLAPATCGYGMHDRAHLAHAVHRLPLQLLERHPSNHAGADLAASSAKGSGMTNEEQRLQASVEREVHWKRWGPYLSERQWGTVREDYSANGDAWGYFPHDHARSRAYRWGEDGIGGICDRHQHICFALALWNEKDPILKERLFGLTNPRRQPRRGREGVLLLPRRHADQFLSEISLQISAGGISLRSARRGKREAHAARSRVRTDRHRRIPREPLFRRVRRIREGDRRRHPDPHHGVEPRARARAAAHSADALVSQSLGLGRSVRHAAAQLASTAPPGRRSSKLRDYHYGKRWLLFEGAPELLFTENETNTERLYRQPNRTPYVKDAFHRYVDRRRARRRESRN